MSIVWNPTSEENERWIDFNDEEECGIGWGLLIIAWVLGSFFKFFDWLRGR
jgi:hypothetical protein